MQYKNSRKILIDERKLEILFRLNCPEKQIIELLKTGTFTPTKDPLIDETLESLIDYKNFENRGGNHNPTGKNQYSKKEEGQKVGQKVGQNDLSKNRSKIGQTTDKDKDKDINNIINNNILLSGIREKRFIPPTEKELLEYAKTMNEMAGAGGFECSRYTAEQFWSHYESCKWIVGNGIPMWNWKAKLKEWCIKNKQNELKKEY